MNDNYNLPPIFYTTMSDNFESFVEDLAESKNSEFSPPFDSYIPYKGDMFSYLDQFFSFYNFFKKTIAKYFYML